MVSLSYFPCSSTTCMGSCQLPPLAVKKLQRDVLRPLMSGRRVELVTVAPLPLFPVLGLLCSPTSTFLPWMRAVVWMWSAPSCHVTSMSHFVLTPLPHPAVVCLLCYPSPSYGGSSTSCCRQVPGPHCILFLLVEEGVGSDEAWSSLVPACRLDAYLTGLGRA